MRRPALHEETPAIADTIQGQESELGEPTMSKPTTALLARAAVDDRRGDGSRAADISENKRTGGNAGGDIDKAALLAWCDQVREIRRAIGSISDSDPRFDQLRRTNTGSLSVLTPEQCGDAWFDHAADIPQMPVTAPTWADATHTHKDDYPYLVVEWTSSPARRADEWLPCIRQMVGVCVEDHDDRKAGDVWYTHGPSVDIGQLDELQSIADAREIVEGINAALLKAGL